MKLTIVALALLFALFRAHAQEGARSLPTLPERHDTLTVSFGETVVGRGILTWMRRGNEQLQVYEWTGARDGSTVIDSLFSNPATLRPIREVRLIGDTVVTVLFERDTIWLLTSIAGTEVTSRSANPPQNLYSSASIEALAATMPLEAGASATFLTFYAPPSRHGVRPTAIRVEEQVTLQGRTAWRVVAGTPGGGTTFWVDAATRTVLRSNVREGEALITFRR